jgi:hypothetical protein
MAGNRLGSRGKYVYQNDAGGEYIIETDSSLAIAGTGAGEDNAPDEFDPEEAGDASPAPKRFRPRGIYVQSETDGARKFLVCFDPTASAYQRQTSATYTIDGEAGWTSTGRAGERLSF